MSPGEPQPAPEGVTRAAPPGLPTLAGGWELRRYDLGACPIALWAPGAPDALLDDADVIARNRFNDSMPYWAWLWDSAPRLARLVAAAEWAAGTRVLELGAGLGLCGLTAARLGGEVVLSDHDPLSLAALAVNATENGCAGARVWDLDWRALEAAPRAEFDVVLGCDIVYEANAHEPVLDVLQRYLAPDGEAWIADPGRTRAPSFARRAAARGYRVDVRDAEGAPAELAAGEFRLLVLRLPPVPGHAGTSLRCQV